MNKLEKLKMVAAYKENFSKIFLNLSDDTFKNRAHGMKAMMEIFFTNEEIQRLENEIRVCDIKSTIEEFKQLEEILNKKFEWSYDGMEKVKLNYRTEKEEDYSKFSEMFYICKKRLDGLYR